VSRFTVKLSWAQIDVTSTVDFDRTGELNSVTSVPRPVALLQNRFRSSMRLTSVFVGVCA